MSKVTLYVIAYDIPNDRRRTKVHKVLSGFGEWTQYSLFECFLDKKELVQLRAKLHALLEPDEDSVRVYPLDTDNRALIETIGSPPPAPKTVYLA
jgi:CRISPR-associated protein Cas2